MSCRDDGPYRPLRAKHRLISIVVRRNLCTVVLPERKINPFCWPGALVGYGEGFAVTEGAEDEAIKGLNEGTADFGT